MDGEGITLEKEHGRERKKKEGVGSGGERREGICNNKHVVFCCRFQLYP